jgi:DNA-directed RNA polymerase
MAKANPQQIEGGYLLIKVPFIRASTHGHTAALPNAVSQEVLDAVNAMQATPFRVNRFILDTAQEAWTNGDLVGGLPSPDDKPLPPRLKDTDWQAMSSEEKLAYKINLATIHGENARAQGHREEVLRKLQLASELGDVERWWIPVNLDFRGRMYPVNQDLHYQGDDLSKALIMFAEGKPIGPDGEYWLAVRLANDFGMDKLPLNERVKWVHEHEDDILDSARDPLDGRRFWNMADSPWQFLAGCHEWAMMKKEGADFVSHLPVFVDGSCNALQHHAAVVRDPVAAAAVNMTNSPVRRDIYNDVALKVAAAVEADAKAGIAEAIAWRGNITRSTVKRGVMTTGYGLTYRGMRDQLIEDKWTSGLEGSELANADYLRDKMSEAIADTVQSSKVVMGYLQDVATALAEADYPFRWTTPAGMTVQQSYWNMQKSTVKTLYGGVRNEVRLWKEDKSLGLSRGKQMLAAAPNWTHSMDAAHLVKTVNAATKAGITNFMFVHDSYGTHACDMTRLSTLLRREFVHIYEEDQLARLEAQVREYAPDVELPERPPLGDFDLSQVYDAQFFFS